jgi:alpha-N-arabinofuranosidase
VLQLAVESPLLSGGKAGEIAVVSAVATFDQESGEAVVFAVNRSATDALTLEAGIAALGNIAGAGDIAGAGTVRVLEAVTYANKDPYWQATADDSTSVLPGENVSVRLDGGRLTAVLPAASWSMIRLAVNGAGS